MVFKPGHKGYRKKKATKEEAIDLVNKIVPELPRDELDELFDALDAKQKEMEKQRKELPTPPSPKDVVDVPEVTDELIVTEVLMDDGSKPKVGFEGTVKKTKRGEGFGFLQKRKMDTNPTQIYLVTMLFGNGTMQHLVLEGKGNIFTYNKRKYHLNKALCWYDVNFHQNRLMFFEDYVEPLNSDIHCVGERRFLSITPDNIQEMLEMEYVKVLAQSQQLSRWLKIAVFLMVANLAISGINTLVFVLQSGVLRGLAG